MPFEYILNQKKRGYSRYILMSLPLYIGLFYRGVGYV